MSNGPLTLHATRTAAYRVGFITVEVTHNCIAEEGDPGRGGLQGTGPRAGQLGGPACRGLTL
eukprot:7188163-Pyramimonas_sp.AAC.2